VVINESAYGGYACTENPTFYKDNTAMVLGDSGKLCQDLLEKLKQHYNIN
jgi:NAD/NADP transhydrogenase beta subunit